jgi:hypothetical protein
MGFAKYSNRDGLGLAELVKKKKVKPAELVEAAIERIERHNPQLNAVVFKTDEEARAKATTKRSGAFAGVPMLLKDILGARKGWPTRSGPRFPPVQYPRSSTRRSQGPSVKHRIMLVVVIVLNRTKVAVPQTQDGQQARINDALHGTLNVRSCSRVTLRKAVQHAD